MLNERQQRAFKENLGREYTAETNLSERGSETTRVANLAHKHVKEGSLQAPWLKKFLKQNGIQI
jgi:hypothetical protein